MRQELEAEYGEEVERLIEAATGEGTDLEAIEQAVKAATQRSANVLLTRLLGLDTGHRGPRIECGHGHLAEFEGYRRKRIESVLGRVELRRAYYHCRSCGRGVVPKDQALGTVGRTMSWGLEKMVALVSSREPFERARQMLAELAGLELDTKRVERSAEASGKRIKEVAEQQWKGLLSGEIVPLATDQIPKLYVTLDGTGVPAVSKETAGRTGKGPDGQARTREVKLGCVFTQTTLDKEGRPVRDPDSSTYLAAIKSAAEFGPQLRAEAIRRGLARAETTVVIGDGAPWIWNLAGEHFPGAIEVVDLYHAREHLGEFAKLIWPRRGRDRDRWLAARLSELDKGAVEAVVRHMRKAPHPSYLAEDVEKAVGYFETNKERMRYRRFRDAHLFVGSGVIEAGCRTIVQQRLKQSGMRWTVSGADSILSLRAFHTSGRWDEFWRYRPGQAQAA